jgi:hypothetical protein
MWCVVNRFRIFLCFFLAIQSFFISAACFANNGNRVSVADRGQSALFGDTPIPTYINNYLAARLLHLTGHALGLDHPGIEESTDVLPRPDPRRRCAYETDNLTEEELWRPHIMMTYTFGYLHELQQHLGRPLVLQDVRQAEAENRAIRYYLAQQWECDWPLSRHARMTASTFSSERCFPRPPELALPAALGLLLN